MKGTDVRAILNAVFPESSAYDWDNVGLQIGSLNKTVNSILLTLDVTLDVVNEAIQHNVELIVSHHPLIFRPIQSINTDTEYGKLIELLIQHNISLYVTHTNFDVAENGMNSILASILKLKNQRPLQQIDEQYSLGVIGELEKPLNIGQYIDVVKNQLDITSVRFIGSTNKTVQNIVIAGGSGSSVITDAIQSDADVLITGDVTYHYALDVVAHDFLVIDVGHNIEKQSLAGFQQIMLEHGIDIPIHISSVDTNPYKTK